MKPSKKASAKRSMKAKQCGDLKKELIGEFGAWCMICGISVRDGLGVQLAHIISVGRGGETSRENTVLLCHKCHTLTEKNIELLKEMLGRLDT